MLNQPWLREWVVKTTQPKQRGRDTGTERQREREGTTTQNTVQCALSGVPLTAPSKRQLTRSIMGHLTRTFRMLLWKDFKGDRRRPFATAFEMLLPCLLFYVLIR